MTEKVDDLGERVLKLELQAVSVMEKFSEQSGALQALGTRLEKVSEAMTDEMKDLGKKLTDLTLVMAKRSVREEMEATILRRGGDFVKIAIGGGVTLLVGWAMRLFHMNS